MNVSKKTAFTITNKIVLTAIASIGGDGAIFWALLSWFGKIWANKYWKHKRQSIKKVLNLTKKILLKKILIMNNQ